VHFARGIEAEPPSAKREGDGADSPTARKRVRKHEAARRLAQIQIKN